MRKGNSGSAQALAGARRGREDTAPPAAALSRLSWTESLPRGPFMEAVGLGEGAHPRGRHLPGGPVAALVRPFQSDRSRSTGPCGGSARHPTSTTSGRPTRSSSARRRSSSSGPRTSTRPDGGGDGSARRDVARRDRAENARLALGEPSPLATRKERAEHVMLVDLGRNDLGRASSTGTVKVRNSSRSNATRTSCTRFRVVEGGAGRGSTASTWWAAFPAGHVSGAPKVRAMEIIAELEPVRRGPYGGPSATSTSRQSGRSHRDPYAGRRRQHAIVQAGAGIVADSNPSAEYQETQDKARALIRALELAQEGL